MKIDAFIFDMDGVIVDSELHWKSVEGFFLQSLIPGWTMQDQSRIIGLSQEHLYRMLADEYGFRGDEAQFQGEYFTMAERIYREQVELIPGFRDLLASLHKQDIPVALASSSPRDWVEIVVDKFGLQDDFRAVVSAQEVDGEGKPSPAIYLYTADKLGVAPEACAALEDSKNGVLAARNAGMYSIGFRNGFNEEQDLSAAHAVVHGYGELRVVNREVQLKLL